MADKSGESPPNFDVVNSANRLIEVGKQITDLLSKNPDTLQDRDIGCLGVFAEVTTAIGILYKESDGGKKILAHLEPLSHYISLLPYFLITKSILAHVQHVVKIDDEVHRDRLQSINLELARIAAEATVIAKKLEDLGKSLIDVFKGEESDKANLSIFDIHYYQISSNLQSCLTDMQAVKRKIDEGMESIKAVKMRIRKTAIIIGVTIAAAAIIAPIAVGCLGVIVPFGIFDIIGVATVAGASAGAIGGGSAKFLRSASQKANQIKARYDDQEFNWKTLDNKLRKMKMDLEFLNEQRKTACVSHTTKEA